MKSDPKIISALNKVLTIELTSINRYFLHARMFRNWGFENLNEACYKKSIKDMKQSDALIERILFLEGLPNLQALNALKVGEHAEEMLKCDLQFQLDQVAVLKEVITLCETLKDFVSRDLLVEILEYEEDYIDWLETQEYQIGHVNIQNYLQSQMSEGD